MTDTLPTAAEYEALATEYDESAQEGQTELDADLKKHGPTPFSRGLESEIRQSRITAQALRDAARWRALMMSTGNETDISQDPHGPHILHITIDVTGCEVYINDEISFEDTLNKALDAEISALYAAPAAPSQEKSAAEMNDRQNQFAALQMAIEEAREGKQASDDEAASAEDRCAQAEAAGAQLAAALTEAISVFDGMADDEIGVELLPRLRAALKEGTP